MSAGLVGYDSGGTVETSYATGAVSGSGDLGGLVGFNFGGTVETCYATGVVSGSGDVGGLVGSNYGTLETSYSTGAVSGSGYVGGLVGFNGVTIETSYSTGAVTGSGNAGGLVGVNDGTVFSSYWATDVGGQNGSLNTFGYNGGRVDIYTSGETLAKLNPQTIYGPFWDFTGTWTTDGNTSAPLLQALSFNVSGTAGAGDTVDIISNGTLRATTIASGYGSYSFFVPADLLSGALITDLGTGTSSTFYNAGPIPTAGTSIMGVNLAVNTLNIQGPGQASNTLLGKTAGSLSTSTYGINYAVDSNNNLSTTSGVSIAIESPYAVNGNITATSASLSTNSAAPLTAVASSVKLSGNNISLAGSLNSSGTVAFSAPSSATPNITSTGLVNVGSFILDSGYWSQNANGGTLPGFVATTDFELQNQSTFLRVGGGNGTQSTPYLIADIYGLQGIGSPSNSLLGGFQASIYYSQTQDIDATGTATWNGGEGFVPVGNSSTAFMGTYNGTNHTISNLTINRPNSYFVGVFGGADNSTFENLGLVGGSVTGDVYVGGLVGDGSVDTPSTTTLNNCYTTGSVYGSGEIGDLAGEGVFINNSYASGSVTAIGPYSDFLGGLAGGEATVNNSYSTSAIFSQYGTSDVGGLIAEGSSINSYFAGSINVGSNSYYIGGLIGQASGTTSNCYATGTITLGGYSFDCGGLAGFNDWTISNCYSAVTLKGSGAFGLIGIDTAGTVNNCYFIQDTLNNVNVGLPAIGDIYPGAVVNGATPVTLAQLKAQSTFQPQGAGNWDFTLGTGVWGINGYTSSGLINNGLPYLQSQYPTQAILTPSSQQLVYSNTTGSLNQSAYTVAFNPNNTSSENVLSNLLTSGPLFSVLGSNVNVANSGPANTIGLKALPQSGYTVELSTPPATVTYTPATLTYNASPASRTYGASNQSFTGSVTGFVAGDSQSSVTSGILSFYSNASPTSNVGSYGIFGTGLTPNSNYVLAQASNNSTALTIDPLQVTVSGNNLSSVSYGSTPPFSYSVSSLVNGDSLGSVGYSTSDGVSSSGHYNAGTYNYTPVVTGLNSNYSIEAINSGTFTISPAPVILYGTNPAPVTYGNSPAFGYTTSGLVSGDSLGSAAYSVGEGVSSSGHYNAGTYNYTPYINGLNPNYTIQAINYGTFTITPAPVILYGTNPASVTYGNTPAFGFSASGLLSGDSLGSVAYSVGESVSASGHYNAGTYNYTPYINGLNPNYTIQAINYGTFTITPAPVILSGVNLAPIVYGNVPPFAYTASGVLSGDSLGTIGYVVGDTESALNFYNPGTYNYSPYALGLNPNYTVQASNPGTFTINTDFNPSLHGPRYDESHDLAYDYAFTYAQQYAEYNAYYNAQSDAWLVKKQQALQNARANAAYRYFFFGD